jgi:Ni/Co efflux regulator RcnB
MEQRCPPLETTRGARRGDAIPERATHAMHLTHGSAQDHRPDLPPAVCALLVAQDGGVPMGSKRWDGKTSDRQRCQERAAARSATWARAQAPRYLGAEATRSREDHATSRAQLGVLPRMPATRKLVSQVLGPARTWDRGQRLAETPRPHRLEVCHYGRPPRWLVGWSQAAMARAETRVHTAQHRARAARNQHRLPLPAQRLETREAAHAALAAVATSWPSQHVHHTALSDHPRYACTGRPTPTSRLTSMAWHRPAQVCVAQERLTPRKHQGACAVIGRTSAASHGSDVEVRQADTSHAQAEGGCRCLKAPLFVVSALCVKKPRRMPGLLLVMT